MITLKVRIDISMMDLVLINIKIKFCFCIDKEIDELFSIIDEEIIELKLKTKQNEDIAINISNLQQELTSACKKLWSKDGFYNQLIKHEKEEWSKHLNIIQETISYLRNDETTNEIKNKNEEIYKCLLDYFEKHYEKDEKFINKLKSKWGWEEWEKQNRRIEEKEGESERKDNGEGEENYEWEGDEKINWEESKEQENYKISRVYVHEIKLKLKHLANLITIFDENRESFKSYKEDISDKLKSLYNSLEWCFQNNTDIVMQIKEYK